MPGISELFRQEEESMQKFKDGQRVFVNHTSGFSKGLYGTVLGTVTDDNRVFVLRDGSSAGCYFYPSELDLIQEDDKALKPSNPKDAVGDKKIPLHLLSPIAKAYWAVAQFVGMVKYGAWNWRKAGVRSSVYVSALQRHIDAYASGEEVDPIDKTPHLGHIMACAAILIDAKAAGKLTDDRPPSVDLRPAYAEVEGMMELARSNYGHMNPVHYTITDNVK